MNKYDLEECPFCGKMSCVHISNCSACKHEDTDVCDNGRPQCGCNEQRYLEMIRSRMLRAEQEVAYLRYRLTKGKQHTKGRNT